MITRTCQLCGGNRLESAIDLGFHPLADTFLPPDRLDEPETRYPLRTLLCMDCGYMTLRFVVPPEERYQKVDYSYTSGNSPVSIKHFSEMASAIIQTRGLNDNHLVVDIGSSDGTLLKAFRDQCGCRVLGIEPAPNIAKLAESNGVPTLQRFFDAGAAQEIANRGRAAVITANNVFNHITDLPTFMHDIMTALDEKGVFIFEAPSLLQLVERTVFDTLYLEHVSYFGIKPLERFFGRLGLHILRVELNEYMGGSMFVFVGREASDASAVRALIEREESAGLYDPNTYHRFMERVRAFAARLCRELYDVKASGGKIIGIGAATKGNTLLNFCKIDSSLLEFVTDSSPLKIGKYTPGSRLPIKNDTDITPDITHALILPWNIGAFLKEKLQHLHLEFIVPRMDAS